MGTTFSSNHLARPVLVRNTARAGRGLVAPRSNPSVVRVLRVTGQRLLGLALLCCGVLLVFTFVLLPVGLPLVLLGIALIAAPAGS